MPPRSGSTVSKAKDIGIDRPETWGRREETKPALEFVVDWALCRSWCMLSVQKLRYKVLLFSFPILYSFSRQTDRAQSFWGT